MVKGTVHAVGWIVGDAGGWQRRAPAVVDAESVGTAEKDSRSNPPSGHHRRAPSISGTLLYLLEPHCSPSSGFAFFLHPTQLSSGELTYVSEYSSTYDVPPSMMAGAHRHASAGQHAPTDQIPPPQCQYLNNAPRATRIRERDQGRLRVGCLDRPSLRRCRGHVDADHDC
jgi:hypothetical protein